MRYLSKRDIPLLLCVGSVPDCTLTAERYIKWYELYLIREGEVLIVDFEALEPFTPKGESAYVDHVPNPRAIELYAEAQGYQVDELFLEAAYGRWFLEGNH